MSIKLSDSIRVGQQKPLEDKYFNELVPYISTSQVNTLLPKPVRHIGLTVNINKEEYWYKDGIEDSNLVLKITNNSAYDLKNQEQDNRLTEIESENAAQNDRLYFLEEIEYIWSPTNRTLTLYDGSGKVLSQVSLVSLDNEGTDLRYNASTLALELYNGDNQLLDSIPISSFVGSVGTQLQLNSNQLQLKDSQGNILSTVSFTVSNIDGLQDFLDNKLNNYYTKSETYSKIEINELLDAIKVTKTQLDVLISENKLEPNRLYKITGVESWCFSQHLIKAIYLKAITNNTLESEGVGEFYTPKYNTSDSNLGIWKGELLANGMISSASYNIGDKVIWGNLFWENISGNIGTNEKEYYDEQHDESFFVKSQNFISQDDWKLVTPTDEESLYNIQFDSIKYDLENDYVNYRADDLGNVYEISYSTLLDFFPNTDIINYIPEFIYNINSIALFQWGRGNTSNNIINESIVLNCNYNVYLFQKNIITENSRIYDNNFLGVQIEGNNFKNSVLVGNYLKTFGGIINNTLDESEISSNRYYFEISNNKLINNSQINNNNDNNIIVNNKYTIIKDNTLDNNCKISNNIFVEEGKEVDFNIKGIYRNEVINNCSINNNTIKNGSKISDHNLAYFSTINGNTLDTEANIYNNQVVQGGKINNNILTGHSRIYGNQLDEGSEITLCKLRIYPTTSYSSQIHSSRLFKGKIQNVDFGDIVNQSGNDLSFCIVENFSIIKDLIFPSTGGKYIQFVKMNGYSEFKNITVNDSIRNVDFINTIFNETSDYSKLIEGSGYQTDGFTKTYIDGVLLQDRFNSKQDILTEDNVGQFMDVKLSTKPTPTSGDTVLGRDSLTGKAVEIPTSSLGGSGSGSSLALGETSSTAYRGDRGKIAYDHSQATGNPHNTTPSDIGLGNVENTKDADKPISTATQAALNNKQDKLTNPITGTGTTNKISKFTANGVIGDSIIYENNNSISIGDDVSDARLRVKAQGDLSTDIVFRVRNSANTSDFLVVTGDGQVYNRGTKGNEFNTFFGEYSGINSTGGNNNAFGRSALASNTTGHANSAFGNNVLQDNTTGDCNNAFGGFALGSNTTGNGNNAFGYDALKSNTEGNDNIAIGSVALGRNTIGNDNTAVGSNALQENTTGNQNTALGSGAGGSIIGGLSNTTPNNSVFIGFGTTANANNETNQIVIGHSAIGNGSNTATIGNDSTTDVYLKGITNSNGFKTPNGTPNKALTADGGVFDLNTKANINDIPTKTSFTYDILVSNWTLVSGKYEAVISNSGILANSFVDVIPSNDNVDIVRAAQIYPSVLISAGSVKVYSKFLPSGTISVTINVI